ncbi:beta-ketoacyl synthase N-terminal-like domain-containing protein [Streptomyces sp. NPDC055607]
MRAALDLVRLGNPGLVSAAGTGVTALWEALTGPGTHGRPLREVVPWPGDATAFPVGDPDARTLGVDRRVLRTTEKQARLALLGARLSLDVAGTGDGASRGLFLGLPTVDQELLPLSRAGHLREAAGDPDEVARLYARSAPPFGALENLNSTAAAHISLLHGLTGAVAVFSPSSEAGLNALVEGVLSVAEGESRSALVGGVSPEIHPLLPLRYEALGWRGAPLGEGAAFLSAERVEAGAPGIRLAGYARGFAAASARRGEALGRVMREAARTAGMGPGDVGWALVEGSLTEDQERACEEALDRFFREAGGEVPVCRTDRVIGHTGPAQPLIHTALAARGLETGRCLSARNGPAREAPLLRPAVMVLAAGLSGQMCAVVLTGGEE